MKNNFKFGLPITIFLAIIFFSASFLLYDNMNRKNQPAGQAKTCIAKYNTDQSGALFSQLNPPNEVKAVKAGVVQKQFTPLTTAEKFTIAGKPVAWVDNTGKQIIVDKNYFSDLKLIDVTKFPLDESDVVGKVDTTILTGRTPREIAGFLIDSQILNTYWHIGADICLREEQDFGSHYIAHFDASHVYFTNERNVENYTFGVQIDKMTGTIAIFGK